MKFLYENKVYYSDTDAYGIVWHGSYLRWMEAARIDGASVMRMYVSVIMPILKPAWMTMLLLSFQEMWTIIPQGTIFSEELKTLPQVMNSISAGGIARSGSAMAVTVLLMIPPILVFLISQGNVMETMSTSGIKE